METFQQLRHFIVIAECGSISSAAARLFITPQGLRSSINSLEKKLGFPLLHRSLTGVQLTEAGHTVLKDAKQILSLTETWDRFSIPNLKEASNVHIIASPLVYNTLLTDLLLECCSDHPNLRIQSYNAREDELLERLTDHMIGIIGSAPDDVAQSKLYPFSVKHNLSFETVGRDYFCVYLNSKNPLANQPYLTLSQLNTLVLAAYPGEDQRFHYRAIHGYFNSTPPFFVEKLENIFQMISELSSVAAVFPGTAALNNIYVKSGQVIPLPVKDFPMPAVSCMLYPPKESLTDAEKIVTTIVRKRLHNLSNETLN